MPERIIIEGDDETRARLTYFEVQLRDLRPFWPKVVDLFVDWESRQFASEGAFFGTPWQPLSAAYAARKAKLYPGKPILYAAGDLKRGATMPERHATADSLTLIIHWRKHKRGAAKLEGGQYRSPDEHILNPAWHHDGMGHNPRRPLLTDHLPPQADIELEHAGSEYVIDAARRAGLLATS